MLWFQNSDVLWATKCQHVLPCLGFQLKGEGFKLWVVTGTCEINKVVGSKCHFSFLNKRSNFVLISQSVVFVLFPWDNFILIKSLEYCNSTLVIRCVYLFIGSESTSVDSPRNGGIVPLGFRSPRTSGRQTRLVNVWIG